jgi:hypothetical protein
MRYQGIGKLVLMLLIMYSVTSCKSIQKIVKKDHVNSIEEYVDARLEGDRQNHYLSEQVDLSIDDGERRNAKARFYIRRDNFIFASINFLGFEIARAQISPDSLKFINRVSREYYFGPINYLDKITGINLRYDEIESIILKGFPFRKGEGKKEILARFSESGSDYIYTYTADSKRTVRVYFRKDPIHEYKIEITDLSSQSNAVFTFGKYLNEPYFPGNIEGTMTRRNNRTGVRINIGNIEYKSFSNNSFRVNNNYNEVGR